MTKIVLLIVAVLVFIGLFSLAYRVTGPATPSPVGTAQNMQTGVSPVMTAGTQNVAMTAASSSSQQMTTLSVAAATGGYIPTNDFLKDPTTVKDTFNPGYYYIGTPDSTTTGNPPYTITYIEATQYFNIALLQEPIGAARAAAEQYLMTRLGVTQDQMCSLKYMVSVPWTVNQAFTGRNLGFSFCPGATALPQ